MLIDSKVTRLEYGCAKVRQLKNLEFFTDSGKDTIISICQVQYEQGAVEVLLYKRTGGNDKVEHMVIPAGSEFSVYFKQPSDQNNPQMQERTTVPVVQTSIEEKQQRTESRPFPLSKALETIYEADVNDEQKTEIHDAKWKETSSNIKYTSAFEKPKPCKHDTYKETDKWRCFSCKTLHLKDFICGSGLTKPTSCHMWEILNKLCKLKRRDQPLMKVTQQRNGITRVEHGKYGYGTIQTNHKKIMAWEHEGQQEGLTICQIKWDNGCDQDMWVSTTKGRICFDQSRQIFILARKELQHAFRKILNA